MAGGILVALLGLLGVLFPLVPGLNLSFAFGALLVAGSAVHVAHAVATAGWSGFLWQVVLGIVYGVAGIVLLVGSALGLTSPTLLVLVVYLGVQGIVLFVMADRVRPESNWGGVLASGGVSLLLAGLLWTDWPSDATWAVGLLFGAALLSTGGAMMLVAWGGRRAARRTVAQSSAERA